MMEFMTEWARETSDIYLSEEKGVNVEVGGKFGFNGIF